MSVIVELMQILSRMWSIGFSYSDQLCEMANDNLKKFLDKFNCASADAPIFKTHSFSYLKIH